MKLAIIAPPSQESLIETRDYFLCLASVCLQNKEYQDFYTRKAHEGAHVILDNGAAEGGTVDDETLVRVALEMRPTEVVAPDIMQEPVESLRRSRHFITQYGEELQAVMIEVMFVPQGKNLAEWLWAYGMFRHYYWCDTSDQFSIVRTIGVPKNCDNMSDGTRLDVLTGLEASIKLETDYYKNGSAPYDFHLLGAPQYLQDIKHVALKHPWVRGIDTIVPIQWAYEDQQIEPTSERHDIDEILVPTRPPGHVIDSKLFHYNEDILDTWCKGEEHASTDSDGSSLS